MKILLAAEDMLLESIGKRLILEFVPGRSLVGSVTARGCSQLRGRIPALVRTAASFPVLALTDLDDGNCPISLVDAWIPRGQAPAGFLLRVAVREAESWVMADRAGLSRALSVSAAVVPKNPDDVADPKRTLLQIAKRSRSRSIRVGMLPLDGARALVGPGYNDLLCDFVSSNWDIDAAITASPSLARTVTRLRRL